MWKKQFWESSALEGKGVSTHKNETLIKKVPFLLMSWGEDEFQLENSDRKLDSHAKGQARLKTKHE